MMIPPTNFNQPVIQTQTYHPSVEDVAEDSHMEEVYEQEEEEDWPVDSPPMNYDDDSALAKALAESMND